MKKAYENLGFLYSDEARPLRMMAEYLEPKTRLQARGIQRAITFWGSARIDPTHAALHQGRDYYQLAHDLGAVVAQWTMDTHPVGQRFHILTGAGPGVMQAAHAGAATVNRNLNVGLNISLPFEQSANENIPTEQVFKFHYFFTRKFWFLNLSQALVVFPGGFGTLDELFEVLTLIQTGKAHARPIIMIGRNFWHGMVDFEAMAQRKLINSQDLELLSWADDVEEALSLIATSF